jgi:hypothetical protein
MSIRTPTSGWTSPIRSDSARFSFAGKPVVDEQPSSDDLREFLKSLTAHEVEYLLIGGFAVALHGYPGATADLDL